MTSLNFQNPNQIVLRFKLESAEIMMIQELIVGGAVWGTFGNETRQPCM